MYSLLLGHMLHNSFQWKLCYTFWKKTLLPSQEHGREMKHPSEGEEHAELLLGYEKERAYLTNLKFTGMLIQFSKISIIAPNFRDLYSIHYV